MPADRISLEQAKENKLFYIVVNAVVWRPQDSRCLILQRSPTERVHPGKYGVVGGKLEWQDLDLERPTRLNGDVLDFEGAVEDLLAREAMEEAGIEIGKDLMYLNSVAFVRPDGIPALLLKFGARYRGGDVRLQEGAFSDSAWVNGTEVERYDCILGIPEEVRETIRYFSEQ